MDILRLEHLCKDYGDFKLEDINLCIPSGCIMGLIGENGAGKSTTIKAMLELIHRDGGEVYLFGKPYHETDIDRKEYIGVAMDNSCFSDELTAKEVGKIMKNIYHTWKEEKYRAYLEKFAIPQNKAIKRFSNGMKMKLSIAVALSHDTRLLIMDEATSGLDPVVRDELLDELREFIQDEEHSVLVSSHILSDLEKICDYITYIHKGKVLFSENKDDLLEMYRIVKCSREELKQFPKEAVIGKREHAFGVEALVKAGFVPDTVWAEAAGIEDIMLYFSRR